MTVLVDSDILIEVSRGRHLTIVPKWIDLSDSDAAILHSPVSVAELWAGARAREQSTLAELFRALTCVTIDKRTGRLAGAYLQQYRGSHHVEIAAALIAACAISSNAMLWTQNRKHYPMKDLSFFE